MMGRKTAGFNSIQFTENEHFTERNLRRKRNSFELLVDILVN